MKVYVLLEHDPGDGFAVGASNDYLGIFPTLEATKKSAEKNYLDTYFSDESIDWSQPLTIQLTEKNIRQWYGKVCGSQYLIYEEEL